MVDVASVGISILAFISALTFHEFSHALCAYLLGDPTAQRLGRLTLNPLAHVDPVGLILLILIRFGWAKPVPFNPANFAYPRLFSVLVGLAGPFSNLILAIVSLICLHHTPNFFSTSTIWSEFFSMSVWINVMLGVFNLIPIPPLDGSHLIRALMPEQFLRYYYRFERISFILLIVLISLPFFRNGLITIIAHVIKILEYLF